MSLKCSGKVSDATVLVKVLELKYKVRTHSGLRFLRIFHAVIPLGPSRQAFLAFFIITIFYCCSLTVVLIELELRLEGTRKLRLEEEKMRKIPWR